MAHWRRREVIGLPVPPPRASDHGRLTMSRILVLRRSTQPLEMPCLMALRTSGRFPDCQKACVRLAVDCLKALPA